MASEAFSVEEIQRFQEMGLGRGIDGTSSQPWRNKTSFQVRNVRSDNVILTDEGGAMQSYEHEISSVQTLQANAKSSVVVPQSPVTIGVEGEMSRSVSTTRMAVGRKVTNRTVSFRSNFQDVPLSHICDADQARKSSVSIACMQQRKQLNGDNVTVGFGFEEQLAEWILRRIQQNREQEVITRRQGKGSGSEMSALIPETNSSQEPLAALAEVIQSGGENEVKVVMHACLDFVRHFRITHYVCAIEIGAAEYKVMTETDYRTEMGIAGTLGIDKVAAAALSGKLSLREKSKSTDLRKIGSIQEDGQVERGSSAEAVVGVKILPITNLVSLRFLQLALQKAVLEFLEARSDKSDGPFIVSCDNDSLYLCVLPNNTVVATRDIKQASLFTIKPTDDGDNLYEFYFAHYGDNCKSEYSLLGSQLKHLEPMARYLEANVNVLGKNPGPLKMKQNANHESSRFVLHGRLSTTFTPCKINNWVSGKEIFYINCSRREWAKDGYICVRQASSQESFITACVSSIKSHNDRTCFMLFRLLPANLRD